MLVIWRETFDSDVEFILLRRNKMSSEHPTSATEVFGDTGLDIGSETYRHLISTLDFTFSEAHNVFKWVSAF